MSINLHLPDSVILKPCITVFGVGGAGCNAVNNMINSSLEGAKFVVANTDSQALHLSNAEHKIQLGASITKGLGAGASPEVGRAAAEEAIEEINELLGDSNMVFITAGMGGGTGTGAAPVIAKLARERGILTVGVVTKPFHFEGIHRMRLADAGLNELQRFVDTLIVIPNQNLFKIANAKTTFADAFKMADDVLHAGVRGITDLMIMPGLINLDFADIRTVMSEMGKAMMGTGEGQGENRAIVAAEAAISNPLLDNCSMKGARGVLINISGGYDMTLFEVDEAANRIREEVDPEANIIFGSAFNPDLEGVIRVSVVATGIEVGQQNASIATPKLPNLQIPTTQSTIEQMQQLYRSDVFAGVKAAPSFSSSVVERLENKYVVPEAVKETVKEQAKEVFKEDKYPGVFFSPRAIDPSFEELPSRPYEARTTVDEKSDSSSLKTPVKSPESKETAKEPFSLFGRMANSMRSLASKHEEEEPIYELKQETEVSQEESLVTEEMLNVPAYQRRK
jgi:cell division protein FtsZ